MSQIKTSNNKAADVVAQPQAANPHKKEKVNKTTAMLRERLKFYMEQFNSTSKQQVELKEQLKRLEETGAKLSGSINALGEMLQTSERMG